MWTTMGMGPIMGMGSTMGEGYTMGMGSTMPWYGDHNGYCGVSVSVAKTCTYGHVESKLFLMRPA